MIKTIARGAHLGRYEIVSLLGAGGMGEVYRARDTRIGRDVAIKVLPAALSTNRERLRRFEQEVQAAGSLNHPNIVTIHDVGTHEDFPYVVSELLEGETLRERINSAPLSSRKAIDYGLQIAHGLAAAHDKGIIHRDLKPENIFITRDGRVKILDFGLAKLTSTSISGEAVPDALTLAPNTKPGVIIGTVDYMSPEQVQGASVDHRSDIFSFGLVLYEMLTGRCAFCRPSAIETMNAILREDPPDLIELNPNLNPALERIVRHCLEKSPDHRFQSMRDLAFDLELISGHSGSGALLSPRKARPWKRLWWAAALALATAGLAGAAFLTGRQVGARQPTYQQLTFRRGTIWSARFAPDGHTVIYGAAWNGEPTDIFPARQESPELGSLGQPNSTVLAVSSSGEIALQVNRRYLYHFISTGTLAVMPLLGGVPRERIEAVQWADYLPDSSGFAVIRYVNGKNQLEFPAGTVLYETDGFFSYLRVSPKGDQVAFFEHQSQWDNRGRVMVSDRAGHKRALTGDWSAAEGLAWSPSGDEIWFTANKSGEVKALYAVSLSGAERIILRAPVDLILHDVARDGRVLLSSGTYATDFVGLPPGETRERYFSWLDKGGVRDISPDGKTFVFTKWGEGTGVNYSAYLRKMDGSPAVMLDEGSGWALSPDGKYVLASLSEPLQLVLLPTGAGNKIRLDLSGIERIGLRTGLSPQWHPDGKRVIFVGGERGKPLRTYMQNITGGAPEPITPEGIMGTVISPDGKWIIVIDPQQQRYIFAVDSGDLRPVPGLGSDEDIIRWSQDARALYVYRSNEVPTRIYRLDLTSGRREKMIEVAPPDPAGNLGRIQIYMTPDGKSYVYQVRRYISTLYLVDGLR
jgi:Tol biopolymer transport system component